MPVMLWRGEKLRLENVSLTLKEAAIVKRFTGLRPGAFQKAVQQMADDNDIDGELMQAWLWVTIRQNGNQQIDITDLEDVTLEELSEALLSAVESAKDEGVETVMDPTGAAVPAPVQPPSSNDSSTPILSADDPSTSSNSPSIAGSPL